MKRLITIISMILILAGCSKSIDKTFEDCDYFKGNDDVMHGNQSPCLDYFILEFNNGVVEFSEAYYDTSSPNKWTKKVFKTFGDARETPHFLIRNKGTYKREGNQITITGLNASNYVDHYIEFTRAEIRGEESGSVNIDVYYRTEGLGSERQSGKINFIGMTY